MLLGRSNEQRFARLLHEEKILHAARVDAGNEADYSDLGRKWRSALGQLGFVAPHLTLRHREGIDPRLSAFVQGITSLSGRPYEISPNGRRLISSEGLPAQQECFLRALSAYRIPSVLEPRYKFPQFSPLQFVLEVLVSLRDEGLEPVITFQEMALFVQRSSSAPGSQNVIDKIRSFRTERQRATGSITRFVREQYAQAVIEDFPETPPEGIASKVNTLNDYADLTLRYLKATGLFRTKGRGMVVAQDRRRQAEGLLEETQEFQDTGSYLERLWEGAALPTDRRTTAIAVAEDLAAQIQDRGESPAAERIDELDNEGLYAARHQLQAQLRGLEEEQYAAEQPTAVEEIVGWIEAIVSGGRIVLPDGSVVTVPRGERPAYLEWVIWRAFLAIDSLENKPEDARRFEVDQDFMPVSTAPGRGPDMTFVFSDAVVVVEVTLTSSSRQEAAEGEPVRRHVAEYAENEGTGKRVYGLFIAPDIDTNTAHTFRSGDWYRQDDSKINLHIVPMQLSDFKDLFRANSGDFERAPQRLQALLAQCRMEANQDAPRWKQTISELTQRAAGSTSY